MLNDALNKIKRNAAAAASSHSDSHQTSVQQTHQSLLLNHHQANDFGHHVLHHLTTTTSSLASATTGPSLMASPKLLPDTKPSLPSSEQSEPQTVDAGRHYRFAKSVESINSAPSKNGSPAKKHKSSNSGGSSSNNNNNNTNNNNNNTSSNKCNSASTTLANSATSSTISTHESATNDGSADPSSFFDIHEKLRELYVYLYLKDMQDAQVENRVSPTPIYVRIFRTTGNGDSDKWNWDWILCADSMDSTLSSTKYISSRSFTDKIKESIVCVGDTGRTRKLEYGHTEFVSGQ